MFFSPLEQFEILYTLLPHTSCIMFDPSVSFSCGEYLQKYFLTINLDDMTSLDEVITFKDLFTEEDFILVSEFQAEQVAEEEFLQNKLEFFKELMTHVCNDTIEGELAYYLIELSILDYEEGEKENKDYCSNIIFFFLDEQPLISSIIYAVMTIEERVDFVYFVGDELFDYSPADFSILEGLEGNYQVCPTGECPITVPKPNICPKPGVCPTPNSTTIIDQTINTEEGRILDIFMELADIHNLYTLDEITEYFELFMLVNFDKEELDNLFFIFDIIDYFNEEVDFNIGLARIVEHDLHKILAKNIFEIFNISVKGLDFIHSKNIFEVVNNAFNYAVTYKPILFHTSSNFVYYVKYFVIALLHPIFTSIGALSTNLLLTLLSLLFLIILMFLVFSLQFFLVPRNAHLFMLYYYSFIKSIIVDLIHHSTGKQYYFQLIAFLFVMLNLLNIYGLIPYTFVLTSQFSFTFFCSFIFFSALNFTGITVHGLHLFSLFFPSGAPIFISPLLVVIEFISYFARVFSLAIRLFANITAGHILLKILSWFTWSMLDIVFASIISTIIITVLWVLEFFISVLQAYVFTILVCIYLNDVLNLH